MSAETWEPFGIGEDEYPEPDHNGVRVLNLAHAGEDSSGRRWLGSAMAGVGILAAAAAAVSIAAQYAFVWAAKHLAWAAALEAGIPDIGSVIFACLGIALALQGRRAIRARALNVACVGLSLAMNALAAEPGWRNMAVWVMPSAVYALASDTLIGHVRAYVLARENRLGELAVSEMTPLAVAGRVLLWVLRLSVALPSTLRGFRTWIVDYCPVAPGTIPAAITAASEEAAAAIETARRETAEAIEAGRREAAAQITAARAGAAAQATAARTEAGEKVTAAARDRDQAVAAAQRRMDEAFARAQAAGQQAALAQHAAEAIRGELQRVREAATRQISQMREDASRERGEFRNGLAGMRETIQALDEERREITRERDGLRATRAPGTRRESKTARFLALVEGRYGELAGIDPAKVSRICSELAPEAGLNEGSARSALRPLVLAAKAGDQS